MPTRDRPSRRPTTVALSLLAVASSLPGASAAAQSLDPTFWTGGLFEPAFLAADAVVDEDGSLLTSGVYAGLAYAWRIDDQSGSGEPIGNLLPLAVAVEPGGKLLVAARHPNEARLLLVRLDPDLVLDDGFGTGGIVALGAGADLTDIYTARVVPGPDGSVYVACLSESADGRKLIVNKVRADGGFVPGGAFPRSLAGNWLSGSLVLSVRPDGRVVVGGTVGVSQSENDVRLYRLLPTGSFDVGFGVQGRVDLSLADADVLGDLAIAAGGGLYLTGLAFPAGAVTRLAVVAKLTSAGALDHSFGYSGRTYFPFTGEPQPGIPFLAVVPGAPEWLVVAAGSRTPALEGPTSVVARAFTALGQAASWFAGGGRLELALPPTEPGHTPLGVLVTPRIQGELLDRLVLVVRSSYLAPPTGPTDPWPVVQHSRVLRIDLR